jgi:hypothetical protein
MTRPLTTGLLLSLGATLALGTSAGQKAQAATSVTVTSTAAGIGASGCTLQEAVVALNGGSLNGCTRSGTGSPRTVILGSGTYLISDRLVPTRAMTIRGPGPGSMGTTFIETTSALSANGAIEVHGETTPFGFTLQDLTLSRAASASSFVAGVAVNGSDTTSSRPVVSLTRVRIRNFTFSGVRSIYGDVEIADSIVEYNSTPLYGGGIYTWGDGATNTQLRMFRSLVRQNNAALAGGGVYFLGGGNSRIEQTTIAQNAADSGAGISIESSDSGYLELKYVTIAENQAASYGGGIASLANDWKHRALFSLLANNGAPQGDDVWGRIDSMLSLYSQTDSFDLATHHDDLLNVDPLLGPFQDLAGNIADLNGDGILDGMMGYQPKKASPVFDRVDPSTGVDDPRDQRGFLRAKDKNGFGTGWNDMGAYEQGSWEAERISQYQLSGGTHTPEPSSGSDANFSDGRAMRFRATANNQFVVYRVPISQTGTYVIKTIIRKGPSGAQAQLQWSPNGSSGWVNLTNAQELYQSTVSYVTFNASVTFSSVGQIYLRWLVTGKNASSSNRDVVTDYFQLLKQ